MAIYSFIAEEQADNEAGCGRGWSISEMCRTLDVSRSGFNDWVKREPSTRAVTDATLATEIEAIWICSDRTYGAPRIHRWLRKQGFRVGRKRVARIMRANGWEGETGRRKVRTTIVDRGAKAAEDRVRRDFNPPAPDKTWAGDITYLRTGEGWLFLSTVIDLYSRRVIGWSVAEHMRTDLVADALGMAVATRGGRVDGVVFHSDRGSQAGFNRLSQHLDDGGVRWCVDNRQQTERSDRSSGRLVIRSSSVMSRRRSGPRSPRGSFLRRRLPLWVWRRPSGLGGSATLGALSLIHI